MNTKKLILLFSCIINPMNAMQELTVATTEAQHTFGCWFNRIHKFTTIRDFQTAQNDLSTLKQTLLDSQTVTSSHLNTYNHIVNKINLPEISAQLEVLLKAVSNEKLKDMFSERIQKDSQLISQAIPQKKQILANTNHNANMWFEKSFPIRSKEDLEELKDFQDYLKNIISMLKSYNQTNPIDLIYQTTPNNYESNQFIQDTADSFEKTAAKSSNAYIFTKRCLANLNRKITHIEMTQNIYETLRKLR